MPADGGEYTQLTKKGGTNPMQSRDGEFVYFLRRAKPMLGPDADLWRVSCRDGNEERITGPVVRGNFAVMERGVYFISRWRSERFPIIYFEFAKKQTKRVALISAQAMLSGASLTISPDEQWALFSERDERRMDLMLVENFR